MATRIEYRLQCRRTGLWVIFNHRHYLLANHASEICMGAFVGASSVETAERVMALTQAQLGGSYEVVAVSVPDIAWCVPTSTYQPRPAY